MSRATDATTRAWATELARTIDDRSVFRRRDMLALGIPDTTLSAMLRRGILTRVRHGVYVLTDHLLAASPVDRHRIDVAAAIAAAEEPTWALGSSAAGLHGLPMPFDVPTRVTLARRRAADERGLRRPSRHRLVLPNVHVVTGPVDESAATTLSGIPTVGVELAAVSAALEMTSSRWRTALFDAAMWRKATAASLEATLDEWRHLGHRSELSEALESARPGAQTVLETFSRLALLDEGVPEPELQVAFHDEAGLIGFVDMWWAGLRVIGEADGAVKYASREDLLKEKVREDRLRSLGLPVVRWTWDEVMERPGEVAKRIWSAARGRRQIA